MTPKHKALGSAKSMTNAQKALKHHQILAQGERDKNKDYIKKFGTFEDRLKNYQAWKSKL